MHANARLTPIGRLTLCLRIASLEAQIAELRRELKFGPARIGYRLGVAPSKVHRVLVRLGLNRLLWIDRRRAG